MSSTQTPIGGNEAALRIFCEELHVPFVTDADALATGLAMAFGAAARDGQLDRLEQRLFDDVFLKPEFAGAYDVAQFQSEMQANHFEGPVERGTPPRPVEQAQVEERFFSQQEVDALLSGSSEAPSFALQEIVAPTAEAIATQEGALKDAFKSIAAAVAVLRQPEFEALRQMVLREALQRELAKSAASSAAMGRLAESLRGLTGATERRDDWPSQSAAKKPLLGKESS